MAEAFANIIKKARNQKGFTYEQAAKELNVSKSTYEKWESGSNNPSVDMIEGIAKLYSISLEKLIKTFSMNAETTREEIIKRQLPYRDLLPEEMDYGIIEDLVFTELEQEMFMTLALTLSFNGNPIPQLLKLQPDVMMVDRFVEKLENLSLFEGGLVDFKTDEYRNVGGIIRGARLTDKGLFLYKNIRENRNERFDICVTDFKVFVDWLKLYGMFSMSNEAYLNMKALVEGGCLPLEGVEKNYLCQYVAKVLPMKKEITYLYDQYYEVNQVESDDSEYRIDREAYLKKLDYYEEHQGLIEGLERPEEVKRVFIAVAKPTEMTKRFIEEYEK